MCVPASWIKRQLVLKPSNDPRVNGKLTSKSLFFTHAEFLYLNAVLGCVWYAMRTQHPMCGLVY
jgi:hypothetical protein